MRRDVAHAHEARGVGDLPRGALERREQGPELLDHLGRALSPQPTLAAYRSTRTEHSDSTRLHRIFRRLSSV